jgi:ATP-dependent Lhr-like helicase
MVGCLPVVHTSLGAIPARFSAWFASRGWTPRAHQLDLLAHAQAGRSVLLVAPTGAGKTLAGFLPSLVEIWREREGRASVQAPPPQEGAEEREVATARPGRGLHTLYVSPLKALTVDVARNLEAPVAEMGLDVRVETRTGDTSAHKRARQRRDPPDILLTTPEQLALMLSHPDCFETFGGLKTVILDELHALTRSKRGDLLALDLARLRRIAPGVRAVGLSATVAQPEELQAYLVGQRERNGEGRRLADLVAAQGGAPADISMLETENRVPWAGHTARYAYDEIYAAIRAHKMTLVFVNARSQAELIFQELWRINEDDLPLALHHGSLDATQRRRVEAAMAQGRLRAIVCTSTLDLGIDWGDVDLVINVGAPKGASRLTQRIGRANHRLDEPSKALLVPANRFEVLECRAAIEAAREGAQDTERLPAGSLDVLAQHVLGMACAAPFDADDLFQEVRSAAPYAGLARETFDRIVEFVATGGYALRTYERFARIRKTPEGLWRVANPKVASQYRLNVGTIVEAAMLKVRLGRRAGRTGPLRGGLVLGTVEEGFVESLSIGDTFLFAGQVLRLEAIQDNEAIVSRSPHAEPKVPAWFGARFPLSSYLAGRVRAMIADPTQWDGLPEQVAEWLRLQAQRSDLPRPDELLVETFPRAGRHFLVCYPFEGRLAHQTLGMLLTRRLERAGARPLGFNATEYALAIWGLRDMGAMLVEERPGPQDFFDEDMLGDDLEAWMAESHLLKRTFRNCAMIAGLIERRHPGQEKTGRQLTVSADLIYDVLRRHQPDHILLQATWADAATGLLEVRRVAEMLTRVRGRIRHTPLSRVSPLAVPILVEIGREPIAGEAQEDILEGVADALVEEAVGHD